MHPHRNLVVRPESSAASERSIIHSINEAAFARPDEADLVDHLHTERAVLLSLVAELNQRIVGHILFSRMWIDRVSGSISAAALAPMAVLPEHQSHGIGGQLILHGLDLLRIQDERIVIVLGHPDYYPRFGFSSEITSSLESPFPPGALMAIELTPGALDGVRGKVRYPAAFGL